MAAYLILLPAILTCFFFFSPTFQDQQNNNHNPLIRELHDAKLRISRLESILEERIQSINAKTLYLKEREKLLDDMENKITFLQSALSSLKDNSLLADERLKALEEEMAEVVTEQWIQIQHLEQALQIAEMRALQAQWQRDKRCTFLKFISHLSGRHLPKMFKALDSYSLGKGSAIKYYMSQALQQLRRFYSAAKKYHHELQGFIKQEMRRNEFTAAFVNDELVFFLASALITFPILSAWMLLLSQFS
ncbi:uncharacterized protein LOC111278169 isoform X2 [Durio zibethinus]|uniref:Uncharacterized protein LOC111278169 isoform X2 n=1 Tax=Durio zibethinus TaxID=66656 RepID=A0A6P5WY70_DURZI|nr:uncharacterized protein LOC111278169 isoform X2 [Durio zibethinus]